MRTSKRYTNTSFTKRVDHEEGHASRRAPREPEVCTSCGAIYRGRRWSLPERLARPSGQLNSHDHALRAWKPVRPTVCPACLQERNGIPGGVVHVDGEFLFGHRDEIERLIKNEAVRAATINPLARIMAWEKLDHDKLTVATTTEHLAERLGHALEQAFGGEVRYGFSHENKFARIWWHRD